MVKVVMVNIIGQCICFVPIYPLLAQFDLFSFSLCPYDWPLLSTTDHPVNNIYESYFGVGLDDVEFNNALDDPAFVTDMIKMMTLTNLGIIKKPKGAICCLQPTHSSVIVSLGRQFSPLHLGKNFVSSGHLCDTFCLAQPISVYWWDKTMYASSDKI